MEQNRFRNKSFKKFFTRSYSKNNISDDIVIVTSNRTAESSAITSNDDFEPVENVIDYFGSAEELQKISGKVLFFKLQIKEISNKPTITELSDLEEKYLKYSIVLFLVTKNAENFYLYWKSKEIQHFLEIKIYDNCDFLNDIRLFVFIANFVADSLTRGHLGIHSAFPTIKSSTKIQLHLLADYRNFNLLLIAAELGDLFIVNLLLDASCTTEYKGTNAQTLAYNNQHFDVLLALLKSNLVFPNSINIQDCPDFIKDFANINLSLNEAMLMKNSEKLLEIIAQYPQLRHFYNLSNESAPAFALRNKLWDMYSILISKNIILGPHEKFSDLKNEMKEKEREDLREIHYTESKFLPDNHMYVLISNSRIAPGTTHHDKKYEVIQNAFEILNQNPFIQIILMIVAASRNFRIVFDFNQNSVEQIDPTADELARGAFYTFGRIYIAAKQLFDPKTQCEALGTLAHELCHCAMNLVYKNMAKPYLIDDSETEQEFEEISKTCKENFNHEEIIRLVYYCYQVQLQHAELIVRVPHLIMQYKNDPERFAEIQRIFSNLFEFYMSKTILEMKKALPIIEAKAEVQDRENKIIIRNLTLISIVVGLIAVLGIVAAIVIPLIIYTPTYTFDDLSVNEQMSVFGAPIWYKSEKLELRDLFPENSTIYKNLTSDHISQIFSGKILDFKDPHLHYLDEQVRHEWGKMAGKLKKKILSSNFIFQDEILKLENLHNINSVVFNSLNSTQILEVLDGQKLVVHEMVKSNTKFYFERKFWKEDIIEIYFEFMNFVFGGDRYNCFAYNRTMTNKTFEDFYFDFKSKNISIQSKRIGELKQILANKRCLFSDFKIMEGDIRNPKHTVLSHKALQLNFTQILSVAIESKLFILSSEAGTGKTVAFEQFTMRIKKLFPTKWVSYIDLKDHKNLYTKIQTLPGVRYMLETIFRLNSKNKFERKVFEEFFGSENLILLWNGFDEISPEYSMDVIKILKLIKDGTDSIQFVCTRPLYSDQLQHNLSEESYTLVLLDKEEQKKFITTYLKAENVVESKIQSYLVKIQQIVSSLINPEPVATPLLLGMVSELIANDAEIYESENLFEIYKKFVEKKVDIWKNNSEFGSKFIRDSFIKYRHFDVIKLYQSYALKNNFKFNVRAYISVLKLKTLHQNIPKELTSDEISRMGILYINGPKNFKFSHRSFEEFFFAQYFIDSIYYANDNPTDMEAELRIAILDYSSEFSGVKTFIKQFLNSKKSEESKQLDPQISKVLTIKYPNFITNDKRNLYLIDFFKKDKDVLKILLKLDENESLYTYYFNYVEIDTLSIENNLKQYLNYDEFLKLKRGKHQKGAILFSSYCKYYTRRQLEDNYIHDFYQLDDELSYINDPFYVFESIAKNLTKNEFEELLTSVIYFNSYPYIDLNFPASFYEEMWNLIESRMTLSEQKKFLVRSLKVLVYTVYEDFLNFSLQKCHELMTNDEIFKVFQENNVLYDYENFNVLWNFLLNHSNRLQQKTLLNQTQLCELEMCLPCGLLLHPSFKFTEIQKIYESYFNVSELQIYILSHKSDILPLIATKSKISVFDSIVEFLKKTFQNNENLLKEFLLRKVEPTGLNIFELLENFDDLSGNLKKLLIFLN